MNSNATKHLVLMWVLGLLFSTPMRAQVSGATLTGAVTDAQAGVVPNAKISVKNLGTGIAVDTSSNDSGAYTVPNLTPADYEVSVSAPGFSTAVSKVTLTVGAKQEMNFTMTVGQITQTVEVQGAALQVDLASSAISGNVVGSTVRELPLNGRDWTSLATLQPGVSAIRTQQSPTSGAPQGTRGLGMQLTISGNRPTQNSYRLDGVLVNDFSNAGPGSILGQNLGVDAIQEFTVLTSNYSAEYGFTSGGVINAVTRSGTNSFHGSAFEFLRNDKFDAADFFNNANGIPKSEFRQNQFGGSAGGPIIKDKIFLFGNYEGVRYVKGIATQNNTLSTNVQSGIVTNLANGDVYNLPAGTINGVAKFTPMPVEPIIKKFLAFYPPPVPGPGVNANVGFYNFEARNNAHEDFYTSKADWQATKNDSIFFTFVHDSSDLSYPLAFNNALGQNLSYRETFVLGATHIFSSAFVNSVRAGVTRTRSDGGGTLTAPNPVAGDVTLAQAQTANVGPATINLAQAQVTATASLNSPTHKIDALQSNQIYDDAFWTHGNHGIKFGFSFFRMESKALSTRGGNGGGTFNGGLAFKPASCTGTAAQCSVGAASGGIMDFLTNQPRTATRFADYNNIQARYPRYSVPGAYFQDDWRIRPSLTLNLGVRYEMMTLPVEKYGRVAYLNSLTSTPTDLTNQILARNVTTKNFDPRIGFAWDPFHNGKTAVRGGFGLFDVLPLSYTTNLTLVSGAPLQPFFPTIGVPNTYNGVHTVIPAPAPAAPPPANNAAGFTTNCTSTGANPTCWPYSVPGIVSYAVTNLPSSTAGRQYGYSDRNIKRNYVYQYNLNIQRQITPTLSATVAYSGSHGVHNPMQLDASNSVLPVNIGNPTPGVGYVWPSPWTYCPNPEPVPPAPPAAGCPPGPAGAGGGGLGANYNPNVGPIQAVLWAGSSYYNGLQVRLDKKMSHGFQAQGAFTWGKTLDVTSASAAGDTFQNSLATIPFYDLSLSKGLSDFDIKRALVVNAMWTAPTPKSMGAFGNRALGGWQLGTIISVADGVPFSIVAGSDGSDLLGEQNPTFNTPAINSSCSPSQFVNVGNAAAYVNVNCFGLVPQSAATLAAGCDTGRAIALAAAAGTSGIPGLANSCPNIRGNLGRNVLIGPGLVNFDFSVFKNNYIPKISESFNLQFRAEFFDIFNRANFAPPPGAAAPQNLEVINSAGQYTTSFIKLQSTLNNAGRVIQFALKANW